VKLKPRGRFATSAVALAIAGSVVLSACSSSSKSTASSGSATTTVSDSATSSAATDSSSAAPASGSSTGDAACSSGTLKAEGSTAQTNAMTAWINAYQKQCTGATINYNPTGSGAGIKQFTGKQVDFAGSDSALDPTATPSEVAAAATACGSPALDLPMVVGPIAIAFKVKGISDQGLTLTPKLATQIFLGKITKWNDPAIAAENKGVSLPSENITVFFRSDSSGTTQNFEKYLAANDPTDFTATPSKTWAGKVGQGKAKSQGIQQAVASTEGSIAYEEYSFVVNGNLSSAKIDNGGGAVGLTPATASAAAGAATVTGTGNDVTLKLDYATKAAGAYPIILVTYEIACTKYADPKTGAFVKSFLAYTSGAGQSLLNQLGYAPIPASVKARVDTSIAAIS
jgi:phosphate transport system substrate-binding protein